MLRRLGWALLLLGLAAAPAQAARVTGRVQDRAGKPVEYASVTVAALHLGSVCDDHGAFVLELPPGHHRLDVAQLGYESMHAEIDVQENGSALLTFYLRESPLPVEEVTVTASTFGKVGKSEGAVIRRSDVVGTPGGAADVFQALRTLPGINAPNEGAAVYVRGGDPSETLIRLDGGDIGHPYHYEGASGGLFSTIDSYMLKSAFFSSGGFGAAYGGVLSGVLDIETQDPLNLRTVSVGANLAGGSASTSWALVPDRLSLIASVDHSVPQLLFDIYGTSSDYETTPSSSNSFVKLLGRYSRTGRLALAYLEAHDKVGVIAYYLNANHVYDEIAVGRLGSVQLVDVIAGAVALRGTASLQRYENRSGYGPFGTERTEHNGQVNLDATWPISPRNSLAFGANLRRRDTRIDGDYPADSTNYGSDAPVREENIHAQIDYPGVYVEDKLRLWGPLYATLGARADHLSRPDQWRVDPRAALAWRIDEFQTVRVAAGRYHQPADPRDLDPVYGNPDLEPLAADHVIAGYEWKSAFGNVRVEGYRKDYRDLVTQDSSTFYANDGYGHTRGIDVFVQGTYRWLSGWLSYGFMDARRKELDDPEEVTAAYGVRHSLTLVSQYLATSSWSIGARYTYGSGRPFTPVIGSDYDFTQNRFLPVYGPHHSALMPEYHRVDLRLTRLFTLPRAGVIRPSAACAFYVEGVNVLGIHNVLDYVYNEDYSIRYRTESYFNRAMLLAGFSLTW
jgi:hypothetical protein